MTGFVRRGELGFDSPAPRPIDGCALCHFGPAVADAGWGSNDANDDVIGRLLRGDVKCAAPSLPINNAQHNDKHNNSSAIECTRNTNAALL